VATRDLRFASLKKAKLAQVEIVLKAVTGGGARSRRPPLVSRGRTTEIRTIKVLLGGEDFDGALAER
jgi:enoyl-CoA hydratase/carnithine racemase